MTGTTRSAQPVAAWGCCMGTFLTRLGRDAQLVAARRSHEQPLEERPWLQPRISRSGLNCSQRCKVLEQEALGLCLQLPHVVHHHGYLEHRERGRVINRLPKALLASATLRGEYSCSPTPRAWRYPMIHRAHDSQIPQRAQEGRRLAQIPQLMMRPS